jgi:hypothetical protein
MDSKTDSKTEIITAAPTGKSGTATDGSAAAASSSKKRKSDDDQRPIGADDAVIIVTQEGNLPDVYTVPIGLLPPELLDDKFVDSFPNQKDKLSVERIWSFLGTASAVSEDDDDFTDDGRKQLQTIRDGSPCVKADHAVGIRKAGLVIILAGYA